MSLVSKRLAPLALGAVLVVAACSGSSSTPSPASSQAASGAPSAGGPSACVDGSITASGSTALQPLVDAAAKQYVAACPGSTISVQGGGSGTGLTQVLQGAVQIGNSDVTAESKLQPADASQLTDHVIARQGWVMVVNKDVTGVTSLTTQQATDIWTGRITNWKDVGGPDQAIVLVIRPASSGTRATFKKVVLNGADEAAGQGLTEDSNGAVTQAVAQTPGATSVIGFAYYQQNKDQLTALALDGVDASVDNMKSGSYKLQAFGHMYSKGAPDGLTKAFLDYMLSDPIQNTLIPSLYYAPIRADHQEARQVAVSTSSLIARPSGLRARLDLPRRITLGAAILVVLLVALLLAFIVSNGIQLFTVSGVPITEIFDARWQPDQTGTNPTFGLLPFILGTLGVMVVAAAFATPLSVGLALFLAEVAPGWARRVTQPAMEVFVGIPSVVYGWLGLTMLVPFLRVQLNGLGFTLGFSWLAGSIVLALMILPTITAVAFDAFRAVPSDMRSASIALGTTRWQTIRHVLMPAARAGIATAIVLGMMRAAGEALAVQMVIGNRPVVPTSLTQPMTTLTSQITMDMGNTVAGEPWNQALWTMGLILLVISFTFVVVVRLLATRGAAR